jgi:hypothetical protein
MDPRPFRSPACKLLIVSYGAPGEIRSPDLLVAHLTAIFGTPEDRVHLVRQQEKALDIAAFLIAAFADPRHGAGPLEGFSHGSYRAIKRAAHADAVSAKDRSLAV